MRTAAVLVVTSLAVTAAAAAPREPPIAVLVPSVLIMPPTSGLTQAAVLAVAADDMPALERCYLPALVQRPGLGGRLKLTFGIGVDGAVVGVRASDWSRADPDVSACFAATASSWRFPSAAVGTAVEVPFWLANRAPPMTSLSAENARASVGVQASSTRVDGGPGLPATEVLAVVRLDLNAMLRCADDPRAPLRRADDRSGRLELRLRVDGAGAVLRANRSSSSLHDAEIERCTMARARTWRFPAPNNGAGPWEVTLAFVFHASDPPPQRATATTPSPFPSESVLRALSSVTPVKSAGFPKIAARCGRGPGATCPPELVLDSKGPFAQTLPPPVPAAVNAVVGMTHAMPEGAFDAAAIEAIVAADRGPLERCANDAFSRRPGLAGSATFSLHVDARGTVERVDVSGSSLGAGDLTPCLVERAQQWRLPAPKMRPPAPADVVVALVVRNPRRPEDIVGGGGRTPSVRALISQVHIDGEGRIPATGVLSVVRAHFGEVRHCYEVRWLKSPSMSGRLNLVWHLAADGNGAATNARVAHSTVADGQLERCVVGAVGRWRFRAPVGGDVDVTVPLLFAP